jgi:hypothetical protein
MDNSAALNENSLRYFGWRVCLAAFFGVMVSFAANMPYTFSLFIEPLSSAFGWHRADLQAVASPAPGFSE